MFKSLKPAKIHQKEEILDKKAESEEDISEQSFEKYIRHDVSATLCCQKKSDGQWDAYLIHIEGEQVEFILGRTYQPDERLNLNQLIPEEKRLSHQHYINSILNEGKGSEHWHSFFQRMISRKITIINPELSASREIIIHLKNNSEKSIANDTYIFEVFMNDETPYDEIANYVASLTHDLRSHLKHLTELNTLRRMATEQEQVEIDNFISQTIAGMMTLCAPCRSDFEKDSIRSRISQNNIDKSFIELNHVISSYLSMIQESERRISITYHDKSQVNLLVKKDAKITIESFLINLINNAIEANAKTLYIENSTCFEQDKNKMMLTITDDGKGMAEEKCYNFFERSIPKKNVSNLSSDIKMIQKNRGEGTLLAYNRLRSLGGHAIVRPRKDDISGVRFSIFMPIQHYYSLPLGLQNLNPSTKKIMLIDDNLLSLKLLISKIFKKLKINQQNKEYTFNYKKDAWNEESYWHCQIDSEFTLICLANAKYASLLCRTYEITAIISDNEMPGIKGLDLLSEISQLENCPRELVLSSADSHLKRGITCIVKGNNEALDTALNHIFIATTLTTVSPTTLTTENIP